jgi:hypothetical protein
MSMSDKRHRVMRPGGRLPPRASPVLEEAARLGRLLVLGLLALLVRLLLHHFLGARICPRKAP